MKTPHRRNITDIVFPERTKPAASCQKLQRQLSFGQTITFWSQDSCEELFNCRVRIVEVGWGNKEMMRFSLPVEDNPKLGLWKSNDNERFCIRQSLWDLEVKLSETLSVEFLRKFTLSVAIFNFCFQFAEVMDRSNLPPITMLFQFR